MGLAHLQILRSTSLEIAFDLAKFEAHFQPKWCYVISVNDTTPIDINKNDITQNEVSQNEISQNDISQNDGSQNEGSQNNVSTNVIIQNDKTQKSQSSLLRFQGKIKPKLILASVVLTYTVSKGYSE